MSNNRKNGSGGTVGSDTAMETPHGHLLVVDDEPEMRDLLRKVLEKDGYGVTAASDTREALRLLESHAYDLVVADMLMPFEGGLALLKAVRRLSSAIPVIIVTAFGDGESYAQAMDHGAWAFISKPLRMADLKAAVHSALAARGAPAVP
jgi:DNA-binding NtrC family response regulator